MREHAKYFYVLFVIVILSFIFWGVGRVGQDESNNQQLAKIGDRTITVEEYWRAYERMADLYRSVYPDDFDPEAMNLKGIVLDKLVEDELLLVAARKAGITVTDSELQESIVNNPNFQSNGLFDKRVYENTLRLNRINPALYEESKREELLRDKMRHLIEGTVELSPDEEEALSGGDKSLASLRDSLLDTKRAQAVRAFLNGIKATVPITINQQLISSS